eukprot:3447791-Rhodomonas_salina.2
MRRHGDSASVQEEGIVVLSGLASDPDCVRKILQEGGLEVLADAVQKFPGVRYVQRCGKNLRRLLQGSASIVGPA